MSVMRPSDAGRPGDRQREAGAEPGPARGHPRSGRVPADCPACSTPSSRPFLRSRREALTPAAVGLPDRSAPAHARPAPGRAGHARRHQRRLPHPPRAGPRHAPVGPGARRPRPTPCGSSDEDLDHLRQLAAISIGAELCPAAVAAARSVAPTVQAMLDRLEPTPGVRHQPPHRPAGVDRRLRGAGPPARHPRRPTDPNLLWYTFVDARARVDLSRLGRRSPTSRSATCSPPSDPTTPRAGASSSASPRRAGAAFTDRWDGPTGRAHPYRREAVVAPRGRPPPASPSRPCSSPTPTTSGWSSTCPPTTPPRPRSTGSPAATPAASERSPADGQPVVGNVRRRGRLRATSTRSPSSLRAVPAASSASPPAAVGSTSGCARPVGTSVAATTPPADTPPATSMPPATRSSARTNPARSGSGATWTRWPSSSTSRRVRRTPRDGMTGAASGEGRYLLAVP